MADFLREGWGKLRRGRSGQPKSTSQASQTMGHVDRITRRLVSGWAFERIDGGGSRPVEVSVLLGDRILAKDVADMPRPDVQKAHEVDPLCGFRLTFDEVKPDQLPELKVMIQGQAGPGAPLAIAEPAYQQRVGSYQDFSGQGEGSSRSHEKLRALRLPQLGQPDTPHPLQGLSVLDLGCNEGFFCIEALKMGAARVVGVDRTKRHVEAARKRCPEGEFIHGSWWDLPQERFDIILLLSAIHYEPEQKALLQRLRTHLKPGGHLLLECGVASEPGVRAWHSVARGDGIFRYPTRDLLLYDLLADYSVRSQGRSVTQAGDPVHRFVFHCAPKQSTAILLTGQTRAGKSNLGFDLIKRDVPTYTTDNLLSRMLSGRRYEWSPIARSLVSKFGGKKSHDLGQVASYLVSEDLGDALAELIATEVPRETELFSIEGEALRHPSICRPLVQRLEALGVRVWIMQPAAEALPAEGTAR